MWVLRIKAKSSGRGASVLFRCFKVCIYFMSMNALLAYMPAHQKTASDSIIDGCKQSCGFLELNSGPLEEHSSQNSHLSRSKQTIFKHKFAFYNVL